MASSSSYASFVAKFAELAKQRDAAAATATLPGAQAQPAVAAFWNPGDKEGCRKRLKGSLLKFVAGGGEEFAFTSEAIAT